MLSVYRTRITAPVVKRRAPLAAATYAQVTARPNFVRIVEVGPRDGLQNEKNIVPNAVKVELIERLQRAGLGIIESGSFVSPKWVPQMAGTSEVLSKMTRRPSIWYPVLVPNMRGLEDLLKLMHAQPAATGTLPLTNEIAIFTAATETFCKTNTNRSIAESIDQLAAVTERALSEGLRVRGYISMVITCPFEGDVKPSKVREIAGKLKEMGCYEVSLGDTVGTGVPATVRAMLDEVVKEVHVDHLAGHFHDTFGMATANVLTSVKEGIRTIDSSVAGLGGCPYSPGATGNVATEDVNYALTSSGYKTNIDTAALVETGEWISRQLGRRNESRAGRAWLARNARAAESKKEATPTEV